MTDTRHAAVWEWLMSCPHIRDMCFNFSTDTPGTTVLMPLTAFSDEWKEGRRFIDGSGEKIYTFYLVQFQELTTESNITKNIDELSDMESIIEWIMQQEEAGNYPAFGPDCTVNEITPLPGAESVDAETETVARYMLGVQIEYFYKGAI